MTEQENCAYINSQTACALITAMGMQAENKQREVRGESMVFVQKDFEDLMLRFTINHNDVLSQFRTAY